jgi:predicted flap endonuclease-1-like 5' DNA nuclease
MNLIFLWWLTLGALIGFAAEWLWDWAWFRARRQVVSSQVDTSISKLQGERDRLAADLKVCGDRRVTLEGDLATARAGLDDVDAYRVRVSELEPLVGQVASLKAENARMQADLEAARAGAVELAPAGVTLGASADTTLAARAVGGADEGELASLRTYNLSMHDELEASRRALSRFAAGKGDPLIDIDGIGPVYEQRLLNAGVSSFAQLAAMTPEEIRAVIKPEAWQLIEPEAWIAEATAFAQQVRDGAYRKGRY